MNPLSEEELLLRSKNGDSAAFDCLVELYEVRLTDTVDDLLHNQKDTATVVGAAIVKAKENISRLAFGAKFSGWLHQIAFTESIQFLLERAERRMPSARSISHRELACRD